MDELDRDGVVRRLSHDEAGDLTRTGLVDVVPQGSGTWRLLPRGRVGAVRLGDLQVQVDPKEKVGIARLLFLLGYTSDPGFRPDDVVAEDEPDLWAALAESLARSVERALRGGVLQGYRSVDEALRTVRGRIRISDQISRRPGFMLPLEVSYDEFSVDTSENRILRTALRRMLAVPRVPDDVRRRLAHLDGRLEGVEVLMPRYPLPRWVPSRLNERYRPALRLAELVLRNASAEAGPGGVMVASFVVAMWKVFEDFVGVALAESLARYPGHTHVSPQYHGWLDEKAEGQQRVRMALDVTHVVGGQPRLIFDAKYKVADASGRYPNADHYQMLAYCTALEVPVAWLIYAQGAQRLVTRTVCNSTVRIVEFPLDLSATPRDILARIDVLVNEAGQAADLAP